MTTTVSTQANIDGASVIPSNDALQQALRIGVFDHKGVQTPLGDLVEGKRSVLIFTRHFWCLNCQAYVHAISEQIPPSKLPLNTQVLIIGNGSYQPIDTYANTSSSAYPIYTDPTCQLHRVFEFKSTLKEAGNDTEKRDYMQNAGTAMNRVFGGIKGALGNLQHTPYIGPKALNGGEIIIAADGHCEYIYRMQNTVDHTSVAELTRIIGIS